MKKFLLICFLIILAILIIYFFKSYIQNQNSDYCDNIKGNLSPNSTIFAIDLHGVVLTPNYYKIASLLWHNFFKVAPFSLIFSPTAWYDVYKVLKNTVSSECIFNNLEKKYKDIIPFKQLFEKIISSQNINIKMFNFLTDLKKRGFHLYILSNIWPNSLHYLFKHFPELKELFNGYFIPDETIGFVAKPNPEFYRQFKKYLTSKSDTNKSIIFVDNTEHNIEAANKIGLYGLEFETVDSLVSCLQKHLS